ncbi:MAG: hypothetical protein KIT84_34070 [Labilithrix sp.]|nr:hypothetical protein [Labilithrix sp.]MCW5816075.1 hypothetical protein [Labilithrix sp.]
MSGARVVVVPPSGWRVGSIAPPKINESAGAEIVQHASFESPNGGAITVGCVATSIPGWVEDMRPAVEGRTVALAGASAALATGAPIDARPDGTGTFELRAANDIAAPVIGHARTFIGFDTQRVHTCWVTCTRATTCQSTIATARLDGSTAPPSPGLALTGVTWAVHHPTPFALALATTLTITTLLAVTLRRKPRHRAQI